jgi:hypothetical protein
MSVSDWSGLAVNVLTVFLLWRQNKIFEAQNAIIASQSKESRVPPQDSIKRYWPMLAMAGLVIMMWAVTGYGYYERHFGIPAIFTSVRFGYRDFTTANGAAMAPADLQVGKPVAMNLGIMNYGPLPALEATYKFKIGWYALMSRSVEDDAWSDFLKTTPEDGPIDIQVTNQAWKTYMSAPLTTDDLHDVKIGRRVLYVFSHYEYTDNGGRHSTDSCEFLETPLQPGPQPGTSLIIYHSCSGHNRIR